MKHKDLDSKKIAAQIATTSAVFKNASQAIKEFADAFAQIKTLEECVRRSKKMKKDYIVKCGGQDGVKVRIESDSEIVLCNKEATKKEIKSIAKRKAEKNR